MMFRSSFSVSKWNTLSHLRKVNRSNFLLDNACLDWKILFEFATIVHTECWYWRAFFSKMIKWVILNRKEREDIKTTFFKLELLICWSYLVSFPIFGAQWHLSIKTLLPMAIECQGSVAFPAHCQNSTNIIVKRLFWLNKSLPTRTSKWKKIEFLQQVDLEKPFGMACWISHDFRRLGCQQLLFDKRLSKKNLFIFCEKRFAF